VVALLGSDTRGFGVVVTAIVQVQLIGVHWIGV
jgi:hypothetical protein